MIKSPITSFKRTTWIGLSFLFFLFLYSSEVPGFTPVVHAKPGPSKATEKSKAMNKIKAMENLSGGRLKLSISPDTGFATFLGTQRGKEIPIPAPAFGNAKERAESFMSEFGDSFGIHKRAEFRTIQSQGPDEVGMEHVRIHQMVRGIPVTGGQLTIHMRGSLVTAVHSKTLGKIPELQTTPTVGPAEVLSAAQQLVKKYYGVDTAVFTKPRLEVFNRGLLDGTIQPTQLAWFIEGKGEKFREFIWINAHTGIHLLNFNQLMDGRNRQVYDANNGPSLPGTLCRQEGDPSAGDNDCDLAYDYSGDTYDYFFNEHGRDSYDGAGTPLISTVHACPAGQFCPYANVMPTPSGTAAKWFMVKVSLLRMMWLPMNLRML
jgi:hypothetical protein